MTKEKFIQLLKEGCFIIQEELKGFERLIKVSERYLLAFRVRAVVYFEGMNWLMKNQSNWIITNPKHDYWKFFEY